MGWSSVYYLSNTNVSRTAAGGDNFEKEFTTSAPGSGSQTVGGINSGEDDYVVTPSGDPNTTESPLSGTFYLNVTGTDVGAGDVDATVSIHRCNSGGSKQSTVFANEGATTLVEGDNAFTFSSLDTGLGTWSTSDFLAVQITWTERASGGAELNLERGSGKTRLLLAVSQEIQPDPATTTNAFGSPSLVQNQEVTPSSATTSNALGTPTVTQEQFIDVSTFRWFATDDSDGGLPAGWPSNAARLWKGTREGPASTVFGSIPPGTTEGYAYAALGATPGEVNSLAEITVEVEPTASPVTLDVEISRTNAAGTVQAGPVGSDGGAQVLAVAQASYSYRFTSAGLGTWSAGDLLRITYKIENSSGGNISLVVYAEWNALLDAGSDGIASAVAFGSPQLNLNVTPSSATSANAFGSSQLNLNILPSSAATVNAFGLPNVGAQYIYPTGIASTAGVGSPQLARLAAMALLHSSLSTSHGCRTAEFKRLGYITNGWDKVLRWDGRSSSIETAGIAGPSTEIDSWQPPTVESAGDGTAGLHLIRYRYLDSKTGYVSEASEEREVEITSGNGKLTFPIGNAISQIGPDGATGFTFTTTTIVRTDGGDWSTDGVLVGDYLTVANADNAANDGTWGPVTAVTASTLTIASGGLTADTGDQTATFDNVAARRIVPSTDSKVDRIVIEMSPVNSADFYYAIEVENTADTTVDVDISDPELEVSFLEWPETGHLPPPVAKEIISHRNRLWLFAQVVHTTGNCDVTNGSVDVAEGSTDPDWRASALGDSTASPVTYPSVTWFFQRDGDDTVYEIDHYDESASKIVLKDAAGYQGLTGTDVSYKIFSRANVIWVSEAGYPEGFSPLKFLDGPNGERAGELTAGIGYYSSMLFFSQSSMIKLTWDQGPLIDPQQFVISTVYGALSSRVVLEVDGIVYAMDKRGWTSWKGVFPQLISRPIDSIRDLIDYDQADNFHACYFPELRAIRWFVCYSGDTYPRNYVQFDIDTQTWSTGSYFQAIADSRLVPSSEGLRVMYGDDQGHVWLADRGDADGCDTAYSRLEADAGATTTVIPITGATLPTAGSGLTGCYLYHLASGEARLISSNTASEITVSSAFSGAPAEDDVLWVGAIPSKLKTKAFRSRSLGRKSKPRQVWIEFTPLASARYLQMRVYDDLSSTAKTWDTSTRNDPDGTVFPGNNTQYPTSDWLIDLSESDGHVEVNIGSEFRRTFELEFEILEPDAPVEIVSLEIVGIELEDEQ